MAEPKMTDEIFAEIMQTEFSADFVDGMKQRMAVSYYKYGKLAEGAPKFDSIQSLQDRLQKYRETGNTEWLIDAANFAMIEFMFPKHPQAHFRGTDADESPGRIARQTGKQDNRDNTEIGKVYISPMNKFR